MIPILESSTFTGHLIWMRLLSPPPKVVLRAQRRDLEYSENDRFASRAPLRPLSSFDRHRQAQNRRVLYLQAL
jgi:hypothetical protein